MTLAEKVYSAALPRNPERDEEHFVAFGGIHGEWRYQDGTMVGGWLLIPRYLWERIGSPEQLVTAFSESEFKVCGDVCRLYSEVSNEIDLL